MYHNYRVQELKQKSQQVGIIFDVMVTGVTGAGKSTTLNRFFSEEVATVGRGVDPETMSLASYQLNGAFRLWDTPGLGDGIQRDKEHAQKLVDLLYKSYDDNLGWVDLVLVVIEGSNRDMGTTYKLLEEVIIPHFPKDRILVAINQADMAMKGRHWDANQKKPTQRLIDFLEQQADSIQKRIKESTGVDIVRPIYYSGEYGYNIERLMDLMIDNMPNEKRKLRV